MRCDLSEDLTKGFYIDTVVETENVMGEKGKHFVDKLYTVHLCPPLHLNNYIPLPLKISKPVSLILKHFLEVFFFLLFKIKNGYFRWN